MKDELTAWICLCIRPFNIVEDPRQLWWSPKRNAVEIYNQSVPIRNVTSKVDSMSNVKYRPAGGQVTLPQESTKWQASSRVNSLSNIKWTPTVPHVSIQQEKLKWQAQPKINSMDNIKYKPVERSVEIYNEKLDFAHATPRVDCGFSN
ncbi:unnamed protein product [Rotaria sordida]|uniref:Uncharacterized protein n=1 Tax=Rotaria sordida TaxID=392033 RepID=A0A818P4K9_9BILA|nr:unnamed protein product [Rotaria sordida]